MFRSVVSHQLLGLALSFTVTASAVAAPHEPQAAPLAIQVATPAFNHESRRAIIEAAAGTLVDNYIFPDVADKAAALLRRHFEDGRYNALAGKALADQMTADMRSVTNDKHVAVWVDAPTIAPPAAKPPVGMFQFERADRLKGNIGYIKLLGFLPPEMFKIGADDVMAKLANADALIIDMRDNHGGDPAAVSYFVSFFVKAGAPVHVNDIVWRQAKTNTYHRQVFSTSGVPAAFGNKPIYILIGPGTFSGGEEYSYDMQTLKLAQLVGETTGGGANPGRTWPLGFGLSIFVPNGRSENPVTKTNWEGVGVHPDIRTSSEDTFSVAYSAALVAAHHPVPNVRVISPDGNVLEEAVMKPRTEPYANGAVLVLRQIEGLAAGRQPVETFSPGMAEALKGPVPADLQSMMMGLGPVHSIAFERVDEIGGDQYDVEFANGAQIWNIIVGSDGKLVSADFHPK